MPNRWYERPRPRRHQASEIRGHSHGSDVDSGEELGAGRIIIRSAEGGPEGLFLVLPDGTIEPADDLPGFGPNPAEDDGLWPLPPAELIEDARRIADAKSREPDESDEPER